MLPSCMNIALTACQSRVRHDRIFITPEKDLGILLEMDEDSILYNLYRINKIRTG